MTGLCSFICLTDRLAEGWNTGDVDLALSTFSPDAVFIEPSDQRRHIGHAGLRRFLTNPDGSGFVMRFAWCDRAINEETMTGFGEFSYAAGASALHGVAIMAIRDGLIAGWHEYIHSTPQSFRDFVGDSLPPRSSSQNRSGW